jgi:hypothetical protein
MGASRCVNRLARKRGSSLSAARVLDGRWTPAFAGVTLEDRLL